MKLYVLDDNGAVVFEFPSGGVRALTAEIKAKMIWLLKEALMVLRQKDK